MKQICIVTAGLILLIAVACGNSGGNGVLLEASAQCLHDKGLAQLAGHTTVAETIHSMKGEISRGEKTIEEIRAAYDLVCRD